MAGLSLKGATGWYDSVYDKELGSQPCIFTSVTPVSATVRGFVLLYNRCIPGLEQCKFDAVG
jgi:hypothetical protein